MNNTHTNRERAVIGVILCLALFMFFAPLLSVHGALAGDESGSGMDLPARLASLRSAIGVTNVAFAHGVEGSSGSVSERPVDSTPLNVPESLRVEWLASALIYSALACSAFALLALFTFRRAVGAIGLVGGLLGALAILHLFTLNAGVHIWTSQLIESGMLGSAQDPFVAMRMLMVRSFELDPGIGLYVLTACLFLASALSFTSAIPRVSSVVRSSPRVQISMPIRVRPIDPQYPEETSTTMDISRHGLYFVSQLPHYYAGMEVRLKRNPQLGDFADYEERGSVVRVRSLHAGKFGVAIRLISPGAVDRAL